jgi:hypothetical protein
MNYEVRIDNNFLKGNHVDGEVLQHTTLNELENVVKTAINANYEDIQKLHDGTLSVSGATSLLADEGVAILSQYSQEPLSSSDSKIPTALQVKSYVDNLFNTANIGLVYYWDGTPTQANLNLFNALCTKYDNNEEFVLFGRFQVQFDFVDEHDEPYSEYKQVVAPIIINKMTDKEEEGVSYQSFVTPPIMYWDKYAVGSVKLTGTWGHFTAIEPASWSTVMAPVSGSELNATLTETLTDYEGLSNKVTSISSSSTDTQYPSAKCVYDAIDDLQTQLDNLVVGDEEGY